MTDPGAFAQSGQWIPVVIGVVVALAVSLTQSAVRPAATAGMAAPVLSIVEDAASVTLAFLIPALVLVAVVLPAFAVVRVIRRRPQSGTRNRARSRRPCRRRPLPRR